MYIGTKDNVHDVNLHLLGIQNACKSLGFSISRENQDRVYAAHGYEMCNDGVISQLQSGNLTDEEIVLMMIRLELEIWEATLAEMDQSLLSDDET